MNMMWATIFYLFVVFLCGFAAAGVVLLILLAMGVLGLR